MVTEAVEGGSFVYGFNGFINRNGKYVVLVHDTQSPTFEDSALVFVADSPDDVLTLDSGSTPQ